MQQASLQVHKGDQPLLPIRFHSFVRHGLESDAVPPCRLKIETLANRFSTQRHTHTHARTYIYIYIYIYTNIYIYIYVYVYVFLSFLVGPLRILLFRLRFPPSPKGKPPRPDSEAAHRLRGVLGSRGGSLLGFLGL